MSNWRRIRKTSIWFLLGCLLLLGVVSWWVAGTLVAPANRVVGEPPGDLAAQAHTIPSQSNATLASWYMPNPGSSATVVLLHPIRGDRRSMLGRARLFHDAGFAVVMIDFQAHGESPGQHITVGHLEKWDVIAAVDFARSQNPNHQIGVVGWSLGGAATLLAMPLDIDALVLESVYPTITEAVYNRVGMRLGPFKCVAAPILLWQLQPRLGLSAADLRPIDQIQDIGCPVLFAVGDQDSHTPIEESRRMFESAPSPKEWVVFDGASHVDLHQFAPEKYRDEVLGFMTVNLLNKNMTNDYTNKK